jgi:hypothetical protein
MLTTVAGSVFRLGVFTEVKKKVKFDGNRRVVGGWFTG